MFVYTLMQPIVFLLSGMMVRLIVFSFIYKHTFGIWHLAESVGLGKNKRDLKQSLELEIDGCIKNLSDLEPNNFRNKLALAKKIH